MSRRLLPAVAAAAVLGLGVPAAQPASRPARVLLAAAASGEVSLYQSSDGVRFAPLPAFPPRPGDGAAAVRRGRTLYVYGDAGLAGDELTGTLWRLRLRASGALAELPPTAYSVRLASPGDAATAVPGAIPVSPAVDDEGALVLLYGLRYDPAAGVCPGAARPCVELRTAAEQTGSDGTAFAGDTGNRAVLGVDSAPATGAPALLRARQGWAALLRGADGCLHAFTAADPHGRYRGAGCLVEDAPASPSGLWDARLGEYRLYGVAAGSVVRAVTRRLRPFPPSRFRPLALPVRPSAVRVAANAS